MNQRHLSLIKLTPYLVTFLLITLFFLVSGIQPYQIETDAAFQIKSVQQWLAGETTLFNSLSIPNPADLSQNIHIWIAWWAPGLPIAALPLISTVLPLGLAVKLTAYVLFILGCWGWLRIAEAIRADILTCIATASILPFYSIGYAVQSASGLESGDVLPFAIVPWLILYTMRLISTVTSKDFYKIPTLKVLLLQFSYLGLLLGSVYWLKYSAFLASLGLLTYISISLLASSNYSLEKRISLLSSCTVSFLLLPICLTAINRSLADITTAVSQFQEFIVEIKYQTFGVSGLEIIVTLLGSLGVCLFQSTDWLVSYIYKSDNWFPLIKSLDGTQREALFLLLGIPGTLAAVALLFRTRKLFSKSVLILCCCLTLIPVIGLILLSIKVGYNYLAGAGAIARYSSVFIIFIQILIIDAGIYQAKKLFLSKKKSKLTKIDRLLFTFFLCSILISNIYILTNFIRYDVLQAAKHYVPSEEQLYAPSLAEHDVRSLVNQINRLIVSPEDVVVLAIPEHPQAGGAWLEIHHRTLPLLSFGPTYTASNAETYQTSHDLRVVLVTSKKSYATEAEIDQIAKRFPQASDWTTVETASDVNVSIQFAELKVATTDTFHPLS